MVLCSSHMRPLAHTLPLYLFQKEFLHCQVGRTSLGHWDGGCVLSNHLQSQELPEKSTGQSSTQHELVEQSRGSGKG